MKKIILFITICILGFSSCQKNVLDKVPLDIISDNTVWSDQVLIDAYLTEAYSETYVLTNETMGNNWDDGESWAAPFAVNEVSDECKPNWWVGASLGYNFKLGFLKIDGGLLEWWENSYRVIRKLNEFIQRVPASPLDNGLKKTRIAEARFLRAYNYFAMVKRYGGVPLITVPQSVSTPKDSLYPKRAKEHEIYDFVISETDAIANDLPETNVSGRPCKYAALALESRAALYAGSIAKFGSVQLDGVVGIPTSSAAGYYQKAYDVSKAIITSGKYTLYNKNSDKVMNFRQLFLEKNNPEVIFVRPHTYSDRDAGGNGWSYDFFQTPPPNAWGAGNIDAPYLEMVEEFEYVDGSSGKLDRNAIQQGLWTTDELWKNRDPRFYATIYTNNSLWKSALLDWHNGILRPDGVIQTDGSYQGVLAVGNERVDGSFGTGFGVLKYLDESKDNLGNRATSGTDWIVFRYGEILLNYAEAAFELGKTNDALDAVNTIRSRAGIATLGSVDRDKIRHERKIELAFEGHRYWDVRRWRTAVVDLSKKGSGLRYVLDYATRKYKLMVIDDIDGIVSPPTFYPKNYYLPITLARTGNNPNLVENPGYN
jgi:hypothetical protein